MTRALNVSLPIPAALTWDGAALRLLDQTCLPVEESYIVVSSVSMLEGCIRRLVVRGAPAIGCAGAFGVVLAARELAGQPFGAAWLRQLDARCEQLSATRPTAVNLRWAVERCRQRAHLTLAAKGGYQDTITALEEEAAAILNEDREMCAKIGFHGAELLCGAATHAARAAEGKAARATLTVLTHCNAGALATGGAGTALSVIYAAQEAGLKVKVFAGETRPLLQGARLTAWELTRAGVDVTVICDNMAAAVMRQFKPDAVLVGADRIAANGDTANKIGTYGLAVLARHHQIPFYVAAPSSTFDLSLHDGSQIPIEERARAELAEQNGRLAVPAGAKVYNPAFDVTPAALVTAYITEKGVLRPPFRF